MKRGLFALLLTGSLLLSSGCGTNLEMMGFVPPPDDTKPQVSTDANKDTEPVTNPTSSPTSGVTKPTEKPTTGATTPSTKPTAPTETPTKPSASTKPSDNTKPITPTTAPTRPTQAPTEPTVAPTAPTETTDPQVTEPTQTTPPSETTPDLSGWTEENGKRYYYNSEGILHTGWLSLDGDRYYFCEDGSMAVGKVETAESGTRYFTADGKECILVNPWNYVPADYSVKLSKYGDYKVAKICLNDLKDMIADCKSAGSKAVVVSAYRSNSYQAGLYERRIQRFMDQGYSREEAEIEAAKRVAVPGTSEHELGLAMDIVDVNYQKLDKQQEDTPAQKWLMANSWKYGFILRYPNEKSDVTGIIYEPWHYRYVGKELAREIYESGLCLEEYFAQLSLA